MKINLKEVFEGWRNSLFPPEHLKEAIIKASEERLEICKDCEHNSKYHETIRPDIHCVICKCTLSAKTACLSCSCPIYKWREHLTSEQEEEIKKHISYGEEQ